MPQLALAVVGAEAAAAAFGTAAISVGALSFTPAAAGFLGGSLLGAYLFAPTQKSQGARLSDLKATQVSYGSVIPYVEGHVRLPGIIVWASDKREIATTTSQGGKGGGGTETTTYTYECDVLYMLCEGESEALRRMWNAGDVIWTPDTTTSDLWTRLTFYGGDSAQLPDPTYEAAVGTANAPAYRGRTCVFIEGLQLGSSGQLPALTFEIGPTAITTRAGTVLSLWNFDTDGQSSTLSYPVNSYDTAATVHDQSELVTPNGWALKGYNHSPSSLAFGTGLTLTDPDGPDGFGTFLCDTAWTLTGDFTIELRLDPNSGNWVGAGSTRYLFSSIHTLGVNTNGDWALKHIQTGGGFKTLEFSFYAGGTLYSVDSSVNFTGTGVQEVSIVRSGGTLKMFVDGVETGSNGSVSTANLAGAEASISGRKDGSYLTPNDYVSGIFKALRVTTGLARYSANYTPGQTWTLDGSSTEVATYATEPTLQEVVERQCTRGGLDLAYVDASALSGRHVHGMALTQLMSPRAVIEMLKQAYFFGSVESDVLRFQVRGANGVVSIPYADLLGVDSEPLPITKANDLEQPVQVFVKYSNLYDDYQDGNETSDRLISSGQNTTQVEFPLALTPTEAKQIADTQVMDAPASAKHFGPFGLTRDYAAYEPTDVVTLADAAGNSFRARITKKSEAGGALSFEAVSDDANILTSVAAADASGYTFSTTVAPPVDTDLELLDIPILRDDDDDAGFYGAAKPATDVTFPGAVLFKSTDDVTFEPSVSFDTASVIGTATTTLASGRTGLLDEARSLTVDVGSGELSSVTRDVLLSGTTNVMLVGSEVIQFRDATLVSAGVYTLTGLLRGLRGTEWAVGTHVADERVVLLDTTLRRVPMSTAELGVSKHWKAVTMGRSAASATSEAFTDNGVGKKPLAPVNVRRLISGSDAVITWDRRSRLQDAPLTGSILLGEESESWEIDITVSGTTTTYTATTGSLTVTGGASSLIAGSTINVYQMSALIGRGYAGQLTL